jgi:hypothetical protein
LWRAAPSLVLPDEPERAEPRHSSRENYLQP